MYNRIRTGDLLLGLNDLFSNKLAMIQALASFVIFGPSLNRNRSVLGSIYRGAAVTPFVKQLGAKDAVHDSFGRLLFAICDGYAKLSTLSAEQRAFWTQIQSTFIPSLSILKKSYADEAAAATLRLRDLETMKDALEPIRLPENLSLYTLIAAYLQAGVELGELLSSRAGKEVADESKRTKQLHVVRSETLGILGRFRDALVEEVKENASLPRDLPEQIFAYLDSLAAKRKDSAEATEEILEDDPEGGTSS